MVRNLITTTLETQGYQYYAVGTISEAVSRQPDLMILDLRLPDMDGVDNKKGSSMIEYAHHRNQRPQ